MKLKNYYYINKIYENFNDSLIGETGEQGMKGFIGPPGDVGLKGLKGDIGEKGIQGPRGDVGIQGNKGDKGPPGKLGESGRDGDKGPKGVTGPDGDKGEKGDRGELGEMGIRGLKGDKGDKGDKGPEGQSGWSFVSEHDLVYYPEQWDPVDWQPIYTVDPTESGGTITASNTCKNGKAMIGLKSSYYQHIMKQQKMVVKKGNIEYKDAEGEKAHQISRTYDIACADIPKVVLNRDKRNKYIHREWSDPENSPNYSDGKVNRYPFWPPTQ